MKKIKKTELTDLSKDSLSEINSTISELSKTDGEQYIDVDLRSPVGNVCDVLDTVFEAHDTDNVNLKPTVSGNVDIAGTILTASGELGFREAKFGTKFNISKNGPYLPETTASGLTTDDKTTLDFLSALTGKRKSILDHIKKGTPITADEAKKCGIIDRVQKFQSKYRTKKNGNSNSKSNNVPPATPSVSQGNQNNQDPAGQINQNQQINGNNPGQVQQEPKRGRKKQK